MKRNFFISLFQIAFKMTKNGVYFIMIAFLVAELFKFWFMQVIIEDLWRHNADMVMKNRKK